MPRKRTRAREVALQLLYSVDGEMPDHDEMERFVRMSTRDDAMGAFALALASGVLAHREELDGVLRAAANRELRAMATVDRNVLRLGAYELLHRTDIPAPVALNEAVELAKRFSTAKSGGFVNAVLDRVRRERPAHAATTPPADAARAPEPSGDTDETTDEGDFPPEPPRRTEA